MADDRNRDGRRSDDATVQIPAELLSILPPPDATAVAPPPPPGPNPAAAPPPPPPPPPGADPLPPLPPRSPVDDDRRGGGAIWLIAALVVVVLFVAVCYLVVAQAEDDRPRTAAPADTTEAAAATTAPSTTAAPPSTQDPASLAVVVLNGTSQVGWAGENLTRLEEAGYAGEASDAAQEVETTTVYIADESFRADGTAVATAVGLPDAPVEIRPTEPLGVTEVADTADVVVVLGADSTG